MTIATRLPLKLLIGGVMLGHAVAGSFVPAAMLGAPGVVDASAQSPQSCCCGTSDGRCCGTACCEKPARLPGSDSPTPQPDAVRLLLGHALDRGDVPRLVIGSAPCWRSRTAADSLPVEAASLQARQVRLDV